MDLKSKRYIPTTRTLCIGVKNTNTEKWLLFGAQFVEVR